MSFRRFISFWIVVSFFLTTLGPLPKAYAGPDLNLPQSNILSLTPSFAPLLVKGMTVHPENPFQFDFIVDTGKTRLSGKALKNEAMKMIKYFLASLTVPEKEMWVNLSPLEKNRIVPESFGQTDMGRDLLAQDYILKKLTASLIYPEGELGKKFWSEIYSQISHRFGTTNVPVNTFNKVWIVPATATVYEHGNHVYVVDSRLKVMLESDYNAMQKLGNQAQASLTGAQAEMTKNIIRQVILPAIEKEVNEGGHFASLRQMYTTMILASWYKNKLKDSLLNQVYANKNKIMGIDIADKNAKVKIYRSYLQTFKRGVYNYIKEEVDPATNQIVPRKYFSGGANMSLAMLGGIGLASADRAATAVESAKRLIEIDWRGDVSVDKAQTTDKYPMGVAFGEHKDNNIPSLSVAFFKFLREIVGGKGFGLFDMSSPETKAGFNGFLKSSAPQKRIKQYLRKAFPGRKNAKLLKTLLTKLEDQKFLKETKIRVPAGFTIPTEQTGNWDVLMKQGPDAVNKELVKLKAFLRSQKISDEGVDNDLLKGITAEQAEKFFIYLSSVEKTFGKKLGAEVGMPLLVAVRSGARVSMAGMMDTILNLGMNDKSVEALAKATNPKFAWDSYRRFIEMFSRTVLGIEEDEKNRTGFKYILEQMVREKGKANEYELEAQDYQELVKRYKDELKRQSQKFNRPMVIPQDPRVQYLMAIQTVMRSSFSNRALEYRRREGLKVEDTLSAVNIVPMVFGNRNNDSGSGVFFTRDLRTGEKTFNLEFAFNAQGEDVVSGRKTGQSLEVMLADPKSQDVALQLLLIGSFFESKYDNVQDIEFTFEYDEKSKKNLLYILQQRTAKRSAMADVRFAVEMAQEQIEKERANGTLTFEKLHEIKTAAVNRINASALSDLLVARFDPEAKKKAIKDGKLISQNGLNASPGAGTGKIVLDAETAEAWHDRGEKVILVREETSPDDLGGMLKSEAILTTRGGRTSHAALVARQFGIPAVVSVTNMKIDFNKRTVTFIVLNPDKTTSELVFKEGDYLAVDGTGEGENGQVFKEGTVSKPAFSDTKLNIDLVWGELIGNGYIVIDPNGNGVFQDKFREIKNYSDIDLPGMNDAQKKQIYDILKKVQEIPMIPSIITTKQNQEEGIPILKGMISQLETWISQLSNSAHDINLRKEYEKYLNTYRQFISEYQQKILTKDEESFYQQYKQLKGWANDIRASKNALGVGANAEEPLDVLNAILNGAERIGLARTEHMFKGDRLLLVQKMMVSQGEEREKALAELFPLQQSDFEQIFLLLNGRPGTIRGIDPPLHEFLPKKDEEFEKLARYMLGMNPDLKVELAPIERNKVQEKIQDLRIQIDKYKEDNPMIGTRGVRLSVLIPEIIEMQAKAIFNAMQRVRALGIKVKPEIMVPLVGNVEEFKFVRDRIVKVAEELGINRKDYKVGTMIEIIAGAENAIAIAKEAEFFSFGTNDLTQTGLALSREDGKEFLEIVRLTGVFEADPFVSVIKDVAKFIERATLPVRAALFERIKDVAFSFGICGEQGVDVHSISEYLINYLDYVSGNANRIPGAIFIGAQLALAGKIKKAGVIKQEPKIEKKVYHRINTISGEFKEQIESAVSYVRSKNNTLSAKKIALAQIKFPETTQELEKLFQSERFTSGENFQTVLSWAQELKRQAAELKDGKRMAVKVMTGSVTSDQREVSDGIGIVTTEDILKTDANVRSKVQEYLLLMAGTERDENKEQHILEDLRRYLRTAMNNILGEAGSQTSISVRLPSMSLHSFFEYGTEKEQESVVVKLAQQFGISLKEVHERIKKYKESNPEIGERGSRVFFKKVAPFYITLAQTMIFAARERQYDTINLILPFINNGKEISVIRNGYKDADGNVKVFSLNEAVQNTVNEINAGADDDEKIHVRIGAIIETPSATLDAKNISEQVEGPIFIDVDNLTMTVWAAVARDVSRKTGFRDEYLKLGLWKKDIFRFAPPDVRGLVIEAIRSIISKTGREVSLIGSNVLDLELLETAQYAGADSVVFPYDASNPESIQKATISIQLGTIIAAAAAARVNVPHDRAMNVDAAMKADDFLSLSRRDSETAKKRLAGMSYVAVNRIEENLSRRYQSANVARALLLIRLDLDRKINPIQLQTYVSGSPDSAALPREEDLGGINFDAGMLNMTIKRDGKGMPLPVNQQPGALINIPGLRPVIINIQESVNVPQMFGLAAANDNVPEENIQKLAKLAA